MLNSVRIYQISQIYDIIIEWFRGTSQMKAWTKLVSVLEDTKYNLNGCVPNLHIVSTIYVFFNNNGKVWWNYVLNYKFDRF